MKLAERQIAVDIADRVRNCNIFRESAVNRQEVARLQSMKLEEEEKQFRYGRSDTDTLIRFQEDVVRAQSAVAAAIYRYHTALVELREKEGVLLKEYWEGEL